jgi:tryptophan halogenase
METSMSPPALKTVVVLGGGTAGLLAALTLRRQVPLDSIRVIHSTEIGVIGVGEGTTPLFPNHLLDVLRVDPGKLYAEAQPTWKLGIRFEWGPRLHFYYSFTNQWNARWMDLPKANGFYPSEGLPPGDVTTALMAHGKAALRRGDGWPQFNPGYAFHIENRKLVSYLEARCREAGITLQEGIVQDVECDGDLVAVLHLDSGEKVTADLFIDASGFRSELLGRALKEPYQSFGDVLFCDRAIIGGWPRTNEPILPYTTAETMDAGWCWRIDHENFINRGYVYSSVFLSDEAAKDELQRKNPKITNEPRLVKFRSGRLQRSWVGNVVSIGNANGFVEPLEATAIAVVIYSIQTLVEFIQECQEHGPTDSIRSVYNQLVRDIWTETRDFLALHYKLNTRLDSAFWKHARENTPLGSVAPFVEFYRENGPSMLARFQFEHLDNIFGVEGHLAMLIGNAVPFRQQHSPLPEERARWERHCTDLDSRGASGLTVEEALRLIRHPAWRW